MLNLDLGLSQSGKGKPTEQSSIKYDGRTFTSFDGTRHLLDLAPKGGRNNVALADGQMLDFDGVGDNIDIGNYFALFDDFSILFNFKANNFSNATITSGGVDYIKFISNSAMYIKIDGVYKLYNINALLLNTVYSFNLIRKNNVVYIYINNTYITSQPHSGIFRIGRYIGSLASSQYFNGSIGNFQLWTNIFNDYQISYSFNNPEKALYIENDIIKSDNPDIDVSDCVSWLPLTEGESSYVRDMASYSETEQPTIYTGVTNSDEAMTLISFSDTGFRADITTAGTSVARPRFEFSMPTTTANTPMIIEFNVVSHGGSFLIDQLYLAGSTDERTAITPFITQSGSYSFFINNTINGNTKLYMYLNGTKVGDTEVSEIRLYITQGTIQIPHTSPDTVSWPNGYGSSKGIQTTAIKRDSLGRLVGLADGYDLHGQIPALALNMTDTQLGNRFIFEMVIERELIGESLFLMTSRDSGTNQGFQINTNISYSPDTITMYVFQGSGNGNTQIYAHVDENKHHIAFIVDETSFLMAVDGVEGTAKNHSFVPSGLNFKDSTQPSPIGSLPYFKIWTESEFDNFDLAKAYAEAQKYM